MMSGPGRPPAAATATATSSTSTATTHTTTTATGSAGCRHHSQWCLSILLLFARHCAAAATAAAAILTPVDIIVEFMGIHAAAAAPAAMAATAAASRPSTAAHHAIAGLIDRFRPPWWHHPNWHGSCKGWVKSCIWRQAATTRNGAGATSRTCTCHLAQQCNKQLLRCGSRCGGCCVCAARSA